MLDQQEISNRFDFYRTVLGKDRMRSPIFPDKLWPVSIYDEKIRGLTERGFKDPRKMIASFPQILGLSFENIDEKTRGLTERGFKDPRKMIASLPAILGYSLENIDRKMKLCRRLHVCIDGFIARTVVFIGMSAKHYIPILRRCRELGLEPTPKNVFKVYASKTF